MIRPFSRTVNHGHNFNATPAYPVCHYVASEHQFTDARKAAFAAHFRMLFESGRSGKKRIDRRRRCSLVISGNVGVRMFKIAQRGSSPAHSHHVDPLTALEALRHLAS